MANGLGFLTTRHSLAWVLLLERCPQSSLPQVLSFHTALACSSPPPRTNRHSILLLLPLLPQMLYIPPSCGRGKCVHAGKVVTLSCPCMILECGRPQFPFSFQPRAYPELPINVYQVQFAFATSLARRILVVSKRNPIQTSLGEQRDWGCSLEDGAGIDMFPGSPGYTLDLA